MFLRLDNRIHAIVTFLALLEMLNLQLLSVVQGEGAKNFWVMWNDNDPVENAEIMGEEE